MHFDPLISLVCSLVLSYVFVVASIHKWQDPGAFRETLANYQVLPGALVPAVAFSVPLLELLTGVGLLLPLTSGFAAILAAALLLMYVFAIGLNLLRGRRSIDCGCGGSDQKQAISEWLILRNGVLLVFSWLVIRAIPGRELGWFDWLVVLLATVTLCLFYNIANQLLANRDLLRVFKNYA